MSDLLIGCHLSTANGYAAMADDAVSIGATTFAFFTRNPRGGNARELDDKDLEGFLGTLEKHEIGPLVAHAPYTYNLCSAKPERSLMKLVSSRCSKPRRSMSCVGLCILPPTR